MKIQNLMLLMVLLLAAGCSAPVYPGDREAARWMGIAAEEGNAYAQFNYGMCLLNGDGVAADPEKARSYLQLAAAAGYDEAAEVLKNLETEVANSKRK